VTIEGGCIPTPLSVVPGAGGAAKASDVVADIADVARGHPVIAVFPPSLYLFACYKEGKRWRGPEGSSSLYGARWAGTDATIAPLLEVSPPPPFPLNQCATHREELTRAQRRESAPVPVPLINIPL